MTSVPQGFCLNQENFWTIWEKNALTEKIPHSWILTGPSGVGKKMLFYDVARFLLGEYKTRKDLYSTPLHAPLFTHIAQGTHSECMTYTAPTSVDDIRQLRGRLGQKSFTNSWRLVGIFHAHLLSTFSINALLKLVEDPPEKTLFFFTTSHEGTLPWTLRSRCVVQKVYPLPSELFLEHMKHNALFQEHITHPTRVETFLHLAQGCLGNALHLLEKNHKWQLLWDSLENTGHTMILPTPELLAFLQEDVTFFYNILFLWFHKKLLRADMHTFQRYDTLWKKCHTLFQEHIQYHTDGLLLLYEIFTMLSPISTELCAA